MNYTMVTGWHGKIRLTVLDLHDIVYEIFMLTLWMVNTRQTTQTQDMKQYAKTRHALLGRVTPLVYSDPASSLSITNGEFLEYDFRKRRF